MDSHIIIIVLIVIAVGGSIVALAWWRLAAKAAPYKDELARPTKAPSMEEEVRVITTRQPDQQP